MLCKQKWPLQILPGFADCGWSLQMQCSMLRQEEPTGLSWAFLRYEWVIEQEFSSQTGTSCLLAVSTLTVISKSLVSLPGRSLGLWGPAVRPSIRSLHQSWANSPGEGVISLYVYSSLRSCLCLWCVCHLELELDLVMSDRKTQLIAF